MKQRILSGVIIVLLLIATLRSSGYLQAVVLCALSLIAFYELARAFGMRETRPYGAGKADAPEKEEASSAREGAAGGGRRGVFLRFSGMETVGYLGVILHYLMLVLTKGDPRFFIGTVITLIFAETLIYVVCFPAYHISRLCEAIFCFLYAPVMLSFLFLIRSMERGVFLVWFPFDAWICDTCAYFAGSAFGRHKLCPQLSPKKTIEGAIGGLIGATAAAALAGFGLSAFSGYYNRNVIAACTFIGFATGILSQLGDLLASGIKRDRGIKDYGALIPGHGGILDRFDSVIFVTPVVYFLMTVLL